MHDYPTANLYLTLAETIARQATCWQTADGMIGDPYNAPGVESVTATARYCAALGHLLAAGRCEDLRGNAAAAMDWCCGELARHVRAGEQWPAAQFNVKDMMVLYGAMADGGAARQRWAEALTFAPEEVYYGGRNFLFYSTAAETLRIRYGLIAGWEYVDELLDSQREFWTPEGMYRDPNDPVTYDLTVRQSLAMMLHYGYAGRHEAWMREALHRGAMTTLQFMSPCGVAPYGGRSNQYHMMEAMIAYFAEWQATQEADAAVAGALRAMALRGAEACARWIERDPYSSLKHNMGEAERFGQDGFGPDHNAHSGYGLLAANLFAGAYHVAGPSPPAPLPCDLRSPGEGGTPSSREAPVGSGVKAQFIHLDGTFHRVFATVGDMHVQIDTRGQAGYDATGLGRLHRRDVPIETALNMSIVTAPGYHMPLPAAPRSVALGAGWPCGEGWRYLSQTDRETHEVEVTRHGEGAEVDFTVTYRLHDPAAWGVGEVREHYSLSAHGLRCRIEVPGVQRLRLQVPVIETDGEETSVLTLAQGSVTVCYRGHQFSLSVAPSVRGFLEPWPAPNRNGVYRVAVFEVQGEALVYEAKIG